MPGPLEGVRVVELGLWVAGPSAAAMLGDWGASVIKLEQPPAGDPFRGLFASLMGSPASLNPPFELDNRGKRSVALELEKEETREIAFRLIADDDNFVTNMNARVLQNFALVYNSLNKRCPRLV